MGKTCAICGKPSGMYPLCKDCFKLKDEGKVVKCEECGTWYLTDEGCPNCKPVNIELPKMTSNADELACIICGKPSNGKHFCKECYFKYKDRSIDIRIINCSGTQILDEYGNRKYTCDDGRKVRSRAELAIGNWLFNNKIRAVYEKEVYYEENGEAKTLHPDFYLPDQDYYIEYNELTNKPYVQSKEYTQKIYEKIGFKVIIMTDKDLENIAACLKPKLGIH